MCESACTYNIGCKSSDLKFNGTTEKAKLEVPKILGPILADRSGVTPETGRSSYIRALESGTTLEREVHKFQEGPKCFTPIYW